MTRWLLVAACILTLVALALMVWSLVVPTVWPVMIAMTFAQGFGTIAFALYGYVVFRDMRRRMVNKSKADFLGMTKDLQELDPIRRPSMEKIEVNVAVEETATAEKGERAS